MPKKLSKTRFLNRGPKGNKFALNNKGGRPSKFRMEFVKQLIDHFSVEAYRKELMEKSMDYFAPKGKASRGAIKKKSEKYKYMPNKLPTIYGFAKKIGVSYSTVYDWAMTGKDEPLPAAANGGKWTEEEMRKRNLTDFQIREFSKSFREAKELQKEFLMNNGLAGITPSGAYIFTAKNITDMKDKSEVTVRQPKPILDLDEIEKDVQENNGNDKDSVA